MRQVRGLSGGGHGVGGGRGVAAAAQAGRARDGQRRAGDAEEGEEVEEQRPGHDAGRDAQRPPDGRRAGAAEAAADRGRRRGLRLGHGGEARALGFGCLLVRGLCFCPGSPLGTSRGGGGRGRAQARRSGRYRVMESGGVGLLGFRSVLGCVTATFVAWVLL